jgi:hypothetical protein
MRLSVIFNTSTNALMRAAPFARRHATTHLRYDYKTEYGYDVLYDLWVIKVLGYSAFIWDDYQNRSFVCVYCTGWLRIKGQVLVH